MKPLEIFLLIFLLGIVNPVGAVEPLQKDSSHSPATEEDLKLIIEQVLRKHPELILQVLEDHRISLYNYVQQGAEDSAIQVEHERRLSELADPYQPFIDSNRPIRGSLDAPVTIVEYSDFECPFCEAAHSTIQSILRRYEGTVRFVYKHNPLDFHPMAEPAARYFEAIALQDHAQAWIFHDRLFEAQHLLEDGEEGLQFIVGSLSINKEQFEQDLNNNIIDQRIIADQTEAEEFGFDGTPAFLINGVSLRGNYPEEDFISLIKLVTSGIQSSAAEIQQNNRE